MEELAGAAPGGRGDALALVVAVDPIRNDDVAERHLAALAGADAAHREAPRIELLSMSPCALAAAALSPIRPDHAAATRSGWPRSFGSSRT
ncbi:hypothetical protein [Sorangium sp. So ce887]|uniref:hypothetical protein n=1 Tax=Sorangium sp. So ce887 TaxID=3133324 RepID=UPI003F618BD6